ncbi:MAG: type VII toxin-antitoxin system MntA family adenylyltransferase antitoxin [Candidatus Rokuibacteriota bacterium]
MSAVPGAVVRRELSPEDRERRTQRLAEAVAREEAVLFAYLFGSFADGRAFEDVDVAVFLNPTHRHALDPLSVQLDLSARLEKAIALPVDVILLNEAPLGLQAAALRGRLLHSRDEAERASLLERTGRDLMDRAFLARESLKDLLA